MSLDQVQEMLLDHLTTAVVLLDEELRIEYLNHAAEAMLQVSLARIHGMAAPDFFHEDEMSIESLQRALEKGNPFTKRHETLVLHGGETLQIDYSVTPVPKDGSRWLLIEMQPIDRFLRINREEALLSVHDTSRILMRGFAHEIKNPLGGIRGAAQLLAREVGESMNVAEAEELCGIITNEADRLRKLVDRMLGSNRLPEFELMNIHEVTEHVASLVEIEAYRKLELRRDYDPSIPEVRADRERLIQALLNITRNAMQALLESDTADPCITLKTRVQRNFTIAGVVHKCVCRIDVIDNGPGIIEDIEEKIFFPMISGRSEGTGLGLPLALSVVNLHQGIVECESRPGETRFIIYIPVKADHE